MEQKDLWQSVLDEIYPEVNSASFHAWFHDLKLIKIQDNKIIENKIRIFAIRYSVTISL